MACFWCDQPGESPDLKKAYELAKVFQQEEGARVVIIVRFPDGQYGYGIPGSFDGSLQVIEYLVSNDQ